MASVLKKTVLTVMLLALSAWVVRYGMQWRVVENRTYTFGQSEISNLKYFARAHYNYGIKARHENRLDAAVDHFQKAVSADVLHMDAWLGLAQVQAARGNPAAAVRILRFIHERTIDVVKWKWPLLLLARELQIEDVFMENINFVIPHRPLQDDALQLLDMHCGRDVGAVLNALEPRNLDAYLMFLIKWRRTQDSLAVWTAISDHGDIDNTLYERYTRFLVAEKQIRIASRIRQQCTGETGLSNPGFEDPLSATAFGWRVHTGDHWDIQRVRTEEKEGAHALQVTFHGNENVDFRHVSQILAVKPGETGTLTFWWRGREITTDQRPFIEIRGFDCRSMGWQSEMIPANTEWQRERIRFTVPEDCHAVTVTLRRQKSHRFDSKIKGRVWLDDFQLETAAPMQQH